MLPAMKMTVIMHPQREAAESLHRQMVYTKVMERKMLKKQKLEKL
jgi:hypothetical protein